MGFLKYRLNVCNQRTVSLYSQFFSLTLLMNQPTRASHTQTSFLTLFLRSVYVPDNNNMRALFVIQFKNQFVLCFFPLATFVVEDDMNLNGMTHCHFESQCFIN